MLDPASPPRTPALPCGTAAPISATGPTRRSAALSSSAMPLPPAPTNRDGRADRPSRSRAHGRNERRALAGRDGCGALTARSARERRAFQKCRRLQRETRGRAVRERAWSSRAPSRRSLGEPPAGPTAALLRRGRVGKSSTVLSPFIARAALALSTEPPRRSSPSRSRARKPSSASSARRSRGSRARHRGGRAHRGAHEQRPRGRLPARGRTPHRGRLARPRRHTPSWRAACRIALGPYRSRVSSSSRTCAGIRACKGSTGSSRTAGSAARSSCRSSSATSDRRARRLRSARGPTAKERRLLIALSSRLAVAVQNARLHERSKGSAKGARALNRSARRGASCAGCTRSRVPFSEPRSRRRSKR